MESDASRNELVLALASRVRIYHWIRCGECGCELDCDVGENRLKFARMLEKEGWQANGPVQGIITVRCPRCSKEA